MSFNQYKIGDFLKRIKRPIVLNNKDHYELVTIKINHKGIVPRGKKKGSDIKSKMFEVREGDFILSGIDARNGAFGIVPKELNKAIVTNDFWYFEIDEKIILKDLFLELTSTTWFDDICKKGSDGTTERERLQKNKFFNQIIYLPDKEKQNEILKKIRVVKKNIDQLLNNVHIQEKKLNHLIQCFLKKTIKGELKSISEIADLNTGNSINKDLKKTKYTKVNDGLNYIGTKDVRFNFKGIDYNTQIKIPPDELFKKFKVAKSGSILVCIEGGSSGKKIGFVDRDVCFGNKLLAVQPFDRAISPFLFLLFQSIYFKSEFDQKRKGLRGGVSLNSFKQIKIPVPSLENQKKMISKINIFIKYCDKLSSEIEKSKDLSQILLKAIINEAFSAN